MLLSDKEKIEAMLYSNRIVSEIMKTLQSNLQEEESEIPKEYAATYTNKINYKSNK